MNKVYFYKAVNANGELINGELIADNRQQVSDKLWHQNLIVVSMGIARLNSTKLIYAQFFERNSSLLLSKPTAKSILEFTQHISTLLTAGLPLIASLQVLVRETRDPQFKLRLEKLVDDVELGESFESALKKHPSYFDKQYQQLVAVGEVTGKLPQIFQRLTEYLKAEVRVKSKVTNALIYPSAIIITSLLVIAVLLFKVIPNFQIMFANFNQELPYATKVVINLSNWFRAYWWALSIGLICVYCVYLWLIGKRNVIRLRDMAILKLPLLGNIINKALLARLSQTGSLLLTAGIPIHQVILRLADLLNNSIYQDALKHVQQSVVAGSSLNESLQEVNCFPELFCQLIAVGEESGELDRCMKQLSEIYHQEVENAIEALISLIEPSVMIILGVSIGGLILVMYLPLFELSSMG